MVNYTDIAKNKRTEKNNTFLDAAKEQRPESLPSVVEDRRIAQKWHVA